MRFNLDGLLDWPKNPDDPWVRAVRETFDVDLSDKECFLLFGVLHNCSIGFAERGNWAPLTQRGAAATLASIWSGIDREKSDYNHWYGAWLHEWGGPYAFAKLAGQDLVLLEEVRARLESHPSVQYVAPDEEYLGGLPGWPVAIRLGEDRPPGDERLGPPTQDPAI